MYLHSQVQGSSEKRKPRRRKKSYEPIRGRADEACRWLWASVAAVLALACCELLFISWADSGSQGLLLGVIALQAVVSLFATIAFTVWLYAATCNVRWLTNREPILSPGVAVILCFVPLLNLIFPYIVLRDLWASGEVTDMASASGDPREHSPVGEAWTILVLSSTFAL